MADLEWPSFVQIEQDIAGKRIEAAFGIAEVKTASAPQEPVEKPTPEKSKPAKSGQRKAKAFTTGPLGAFDLAKREQRKVYDVLKMLLPLYLPFRSKGRAAKCKQATLGDGGKSLPFLTGIMASKIEQPTNLRLCPLCAAEDKKAFGEPYWHRSHQVAGVTTCYRHGIRLLETPTRRSGRLNRHEFQCPPKTRQEIEGATIEGDGRLAADTQWLLNGNDFEPGLNLLKENYLIALQEKRLARPSGRAYITQLTEQFIERHGDELLVRLGCPLSTDQNSSWLADMLRDRPRCAHPIQHLLLINFLGNTAQSFFEILQERKKPKCAAPSTRKETNQKLIDQEFLARLWADRQISLREIGRRLRVDPMTVKRHAARVGLRFPREGVRLTRNRPPQPRVHRKRLDFHRQRWERALAKPEPQGLRKRLPSTYSYLFRFDREWLDQHRPPSPAPKPRKPRVDWQARDRELTQKIQEIVIRSPEPFAQGKLLVELGIGNMLRRKPDQTN
jgi:hypothetical protein